MSTRSPRRCKQTAPPRSSSRGRIFSPASARSRRPCGGRAEHGDPAVPEARGTMKATRPALLRAGDVGATKTNLGLFTATGEALTPVAEAHFVNDGYAGLEDVVRAFLAREAYVLTAACFGVAGPVADG